MSSSPSTATPLRWGFLGCGKISSDFANAMKNSPSAVFQACAARSLTSAQEFAQTHGFAQAYGSYEELAADPQVDVVYIGTLHISHYEHSVLALSHGKHVVVEKPMSMNSRQAAHVVSLAKEKQLFFMEGMWTRFFPATRYIRELLAQGAIGEPHYVAADIGFKFAPDNARMWERKLGGGGLLDIGIYPLAFVTMVLGGSPTKISATGKLSDDGVDIYGSATLEYAGDRFGTIQYSCLAEFQEAVTIVGTKGRILIQSEAHVPTKVTTIRRLDDGTTQTHESRFPVIEEHASATPSNFGGSMGFFYEIEAVTQAIEAKLTLQHEYPPEESLAIARIMDEIRKQVGVVYEADIAK